MKPRSEHREALVEALKRYGYTRVGYPSRITFEDGWDCIDDRVPLRYPSQIKPYDVYFDLDCLILVHRDCDLCDGYVHDRQFLQEMIAVIGRLDAQAHPATWEDDGNAPRLKIYV